MRAGGGAGVKLRDVVRLLPVVLPLLASLTAVWATPASAASSNGLWDFVSAPYLHPPKLQVLVRKPGLAPGYFMVTDEPSFAFGGHQQDGGPELLDSRARPVWFARSSGPPFDLQQQTYQGRPVLVWFASPEGLSRGPGGRRHAGGTGRFVIMDEHYHRLATIAARSPWTTDLHDAAIVGSNIWITAIRNVPHQRLNPYGGPRHGSVIDVGLQEFNIRTGRLLRTWDALNPGGRPNVPLSTSHEGASGGWDAYHLNSVQALPDGDLLLSMRNTWSVYLVNPARHRIMWTLGGQDSSFKISDRTRFAWQHDARLVQPSDRGRGTDVELTLFDDNSGRGGAKGMILRLNTVTHTVRLVAAYRHHPPYTAEFLGSMQLLHNGNALVGWGSPYGYFTEFSPSGKELLNVAWPLHGQSYRALLTDSWVGTPNYPPRGAVQGNLVYASWNGATQVARWEVLAGSSSGKLTAVASHARRGFETAITLNQSYAVYEVRALTAHGRVLGTSKAFAPA